MPPANPFATKPCHTKPFRCAADLSHETGSVSDDTPNSAVFQIFERNPALQRLPVTRNEQILGLIDRQYFMTRMESHFHRGIHGRKPCTRLMDDTPLIIEADTPIPAIARQLLAAGSNRSLAGSFIVTRAGHLVGTGGASEVMAALLPQEQQATDEPGEGHERLSRPTGSPPQDIGQSKPEPARQGTNEFLAAMARELRTPLHGILAFAQIGQEKAGEAPREKLSRYFSYITESAHRLSQAIHELLELSELDAGASNFQVVPADLCGLARRVVNELTPRAAERIIALRLETAMTRAPIMCEPERICQVLSNVIGNAIDYSPPASTVTVKTDWKYPPGADRNTPPSMAIIHVIDQGPGLPADLQEPPADAFAQTTAQRCMGSKGMGLAISRRIMRLHAGRISARNNAAGRGACISIEFPL